MRRTITIVLVASALVALAIQPAAADFTYNARYSEKYVEGGWDSGEWGDDTLVWGWASARLQKGAKAGELYFSETIGELVVCPADPDNPDDDYLGYVWTVREGWGPATVTTAKRYASGAATATVELWTWTLSDCDWWSEDASPTNGGSPGEEAAVTISMTATGPLVKQSDRYVFHIPGEYNEHSSSRSLYRQAAGEVTVDDATHASDWGQLGEYSWRSHANGN